MRPVGLAFGAGRASCGSRRFEAWKLVGRAEREEKAGRRCGDEGTHPAAMAEERALKRIRSCSAIGMSSTIGPAALAFSASKRGAGMSARRPVTSLHRRQPAGGPSGPGGSPQPQLTALQARHGAVLALGPSFEDRVKDVQDHPEPVRALRDAGMAKG